MYHIQPSFPRGACVGLVSTGPCLIGGTALTTAVGLTDRTVHCCLGRGGVVSRLHIVCVHELCTRARERERERVSDVHGVWLSVRNMEPNQIRFQCPFLLFSSSLAPALAYFYPGEKILGWRPSTPVLCSANARVLPAPCACVLHDCCP